jgi:hypothetical protein
MDDGQRLRLNINGQPIHINLPDWQLIPIIRFASKDTFAAITLFGKLKDPKEQTQVEKRRGRIINYHPAFANTLLGLRLMQLDLLIISESAADLPVGREGEARKYILGRGEVPPDIEKGRAAYRTIKAYIKGILKDDMFDSYLICDCDQSVTFDMRDETLQLTGYPVYYFWQSKMSNPKYNEDERFDKVDTSIRLQLQSDSKNKRANFDAKAWYIQRIKTLLNSTEFQDLKNSLPDLTIVDILGLPSNIPIEQSLKKLDEDELHEIFLQLQIGIESISIEYMSDLSRSILSQRDQLRTINPAVWNVAVNTMRFAAFFRYCKNKFPKQWGRLMDQILNVEVEPKVTTPTVLYDAPWRSGEPTRAPSSPNTKEERTISAPR